MQFISMNYFSFWTSNKRFPWQAKWYVCPAAFSHFIFFSSKAIFIMHRECFNNNILNGTQDILHFRLLADSKNTRTNSHRGIWARRRRRWQCHWLWQTFAWFHEREREKEKFASLFQMVVGSRNSKLFGFWWYAENRATFGRFNIQSNYDQYMKFGEKQKTKEHPWKKNFFFWSATTIWLKACVACNISIYIYIYKWINLLI